MSDGHYSSTSYSSGKGHNHRAGNGLTVVRRRPNFVAVPYELVDDETISAQAKAVYMILDRFADYDSGATFVGKDRIARLCGYAKADSVDPYLKELRSRGWITWSRRWRRNTGQKASDGRFIYEYSYTSGKGFEPTTSLYVVNDRVAPTILDGEGVPPTGGTPIPATGGTPIPATGGTGIPATAGTNENQKNENQKKGGVEVGGLVTDTHARDENSPLKDFSIPSEEEPPALRASGGTESRFNDRQSTREGEDVVSEPDHPWSESAMLSHRPEHLKTVAEKYAKKPHASRCPVHEREDRSVPCHNCKQVRLYAEEIAERLNGKYSEEKARRKQEINDCRMCDPRGMKDYKLPDGSPQAVTCQHSPEWFDRFMDEVSERFLADRAEEQRQRELRQQSPSRDKALAKMRELRRSRFKAS